jgi:hypothetical protein
MACVEGESLAQFCANRFVRRENPRGFANYFFGSEYGRGASDTALRAFRRSVMRCCRIRVGAKQNR